MQIWCYINYHWNNTKIKSIQSKLFQCLFYTNKALNLGHLVKVLWKHLNSTNTKGSPLCNGPTRLGRPERRECLRACWLYTDLRPVESCRQKLEKSCRTGNELPCIKQKMQGSHHSQHPLAAGWKRQPPASRRLDQRSHSHLWHPSWLGLFRARISPRSSQRGWIQKKLRPMGAFKPPPIKHSPFQQQTSTWSEYYLRRDLGRPSKWPRNWRLQAINLPSIGSLKPGSSKISHGT